MTNASGFSFDLPHSFVCGDRSPGENVCLCAVVGDLRIKSVSSCTWVRFLPHVAPSKYLWRPRVISLGVSRMTNSTTESLKPRTVLCLAGPNISLDRILFDLLNENEQPTRIVREPSALVDERRLETVGLLLMECTEKNGQMVIDYVAKLKAKRDDLIIILVNGGLSLMQRAQAYQAGVKDYFSTPYDSVLIAERILHLIRSSAPRPKFLNPKPNPIQDKDK